MAANSSNSDTSSSGALSTDISIGSGQRSSDNGTSSKGRSGNTDTSSDGNDSLSTSRMTSGGAGGRGSHWSFEPTSCLCCSCLCSDCRHECVMLPTVKGFVMWVRGSSNLGRRRSWAVETRSTVCIQHLAGVSSDLAAFHQHMNLHTAKDIQGHAPLARCKRFELKSGW